MEIALKLSADDSPGGRSLIRVAATAVASSSLMFKLYSCISMNAPLHQLGCG
jgi:hypothetical protein